MKNKNKYKTTTQNETRLNTHLCSKGVGRSQSLFNLTPFPHVSSIYTIINLKIVIMRVILPKFLPKGREQTKTQLNAILNDETKPKDRGKVM